MSASLNMSASLEGSVAVRLAVAGGRVRAATMTMQRPDAARALIGRTPEEAVRLVPLLFSLCSTAQALAAAEALESAIAIDAAPHATARALLVAAEVADSHAWQALVDWPKRLGETPQPQALAPLRAATAAIPAALYPDRDGLRLGGGTLRPDHTALGTAIARLRELVQQTVFGGPPPADARSLAVWVSVGATPAARLMDRALAPDLAGFGASDAPSLGPLARQRAHPLVTALLDRHGPGVAAHAAARLAELSDLPDRMARLTAALDDSPIGTTPAPQNRDGTGAGSGTVETARGRLTHRVRLADGRIADYRIEAPTDRNFAADGPLARGLSGACADDGLPERAGMLVTALDPCVACTISIVDED